MDILKELNEKEKKTILLVTHNPEFIDYGDRVAHMKDGLITQETVISSKGYKYMMVKGSEPKEAPTSELENIMRVYKGMTPEQINIIIMPYKAKTFAHHFITNRNMEEIKIFEDAIHKRLLRITSTKEFFKILNLSYQEGGVGFDKRTAQRIVKDINNKIKMSYLIYRKFRQRKDRYGRHKRITHEERIEKLIDYLLRNCWLEDQKKISGVALRRFEEALADRLFHEVSKVNFFKFLDKPLKEGGVGLHSHAARRVTEEIELLLILGYGAQQKGVREMLKPGISKSIEDQKAEIANRIDTSRKFN